MNRAAQLEASDAPGSMHYMYTLQCKAWRSTCDGRFHMARAGPRGTGGPLPQATPPRLAACQWRLHHRATPDCHVCGWDVRVREGRTDVRTAIWLRTELGIYSQVQAPFLPPMRTWEDDDSYPFLVLEDLSGAIWQAPWTMARVTQVLDTLRQVAATPPPAWLPRLQERWSRLGWA